MAVRFATILAWQLILTHKIAAAACCCDTCKRASRQLAIRLRQKRVLASAVKWITNPAWCVLFRVYPFLHDGANRLEPTDQIRPVLLPDVAPFTICNGPGEPRCNRGCRRPSTSCAEFVSEYQRAEHREQWDAVVTCFFLDTAKNPLDYIRNPSFQAIVAATSF